MKDSSRLLLTAVARSENQGTVYNATRTLLRESGSSPILMEPVSGKISFPWGERPEPQIFALDTGGKRREKIPAARNGKNIQISLGQTQAYEIVFERSS